MGLSYGNLAEARHHRARPIGPEALAAYQKALALIHETGDLNEEIKALTNLADLYMEMGDFVAALSRYETAIVLIESLRSRVTSEEARSGFSQRSSRPTPVLLMLARTCAIFQSI